MAFMITIGYHSRPPFSGLKLHQFRSLIALAESGSIRGAARALGLSQPAITKSIGQLERELKVALVSRNARGATLTELGKALLPRARAIDSEVHRAREEIEQLTNTRQGSIGVGASGLAAITLLPGALRALRKDFPGARVQVVDGLFPQVALPLREGTLDLVLGPLPPMRQQGEFVYEQLFVSPLYIVARRGHPLRKRVTRLADLVDAEWLIGGPRGKQSSMVEEIFAEHGLPKPRIALQTTSVIPVQSIIAGTDLLGLLPERLFKGWAGLEIEALPIKEALRPVPMGIITRADVPLTAMAEAFVKYIRHEAASWRSSMRRTPR
jgi:DNA-binding transcriptional LysR family regulator